MDNRKYNLVVCGCGPAGISPLIYLEEHGLLDAMLSKGICMIEASARIGSGEFCRYQITANSLGKVFLEVFQEQSSWMLTHLKKLPSYEKMLAYAEKPVPLPILGEFLADIGRLLTEKVKAHPNGRVLDLTRVTCIQRRADGRYDITFEPVLPQGEAETITADQVLYNLGGQQTMPNFLKPYLKSGKAVWLSGDFLQAKHDAVLAEMLATSQHTLKIVTIGASHSAFSCLYRLRHHFRLLPNDKASIHLTYRSQIRLFYDTVEDAHQDGYYEFDPSLDVCSMSGRVHRYAGLRYDSFSLGREVLKGCIPNVHLVGLTTQSEDEYDLLLAEADVILVCTGYRFRKVDLLDEQGTPLAFMEDHITVVTDTSCRPFLANGELLDGFYLYGLGAGLRPGGSNYGDVSYSGRIDGVWVYQHLVTKALLQAGLAREETHHEKQIALGRI